MKKIKFPQFLITNYQLLAILFLATVVRFGGLTWCFPYAPHPDEWNMAAAIARLSWQKNLNPHFFAYGQFPLYLTYFSAILYNLIPWIKIKNINIQEAIFFLRFWSALAGTATVYLVYLISRHLFPIKPLTTQKSPITNYQLLIAPLLAAFTPGLIQISHFGTTESLLSFFFLLILLLSFKILEKPKLKYYILTGITLGLALGTKISAPIFIFPAFLVFIFNFFKTLKNKNKINNLGKLFLKNLVLLVLLFLLVLLVSPYLFLAYKESRNTLLYETSVATGQSLVFYTRQFIETPPIIFHLQKIFPYALGVPIFILGIFGFLFSLISLIFPISRKRPLITNYQLLITILALLTYFLSQAFLFCKWTRFMAPIFAFFPIFAAITFQKISSFKKLLITNYQLPITFIAILPGIVFSSIYFSPDIRFTASNWIYKNIPSGSQILFDTGNVVDIPIVNPKSSLPLPTSHFQSVSFDFYHLDENRQLYYQLIENLENSDYIIVPSRRIYANHIRLPEKFPLTAKYYELLFSGKLGFEEMKIFRPFPQFQISNFKFQIDDEQSEETFTVFDHPTIRIYKKTVKLAAGYYESLFQ